MFDGMNTDQNKELRERFPWLGYKYRGKTYLRPEYYLSLLKPYVFGGRSDLELFRDFLVTDQRVHPLRVMEIGAGPGRATKTLVVGPKIEGLLLIEQSSEMIKAAKSNLDSHLPIQYVVADAIDYLATTHECFDLTFSLWSLSHAIHQRIAALGVSVGSKSVADSVERFLLECMSPGARLFIIHFDPFSPEQRIALRQRSRAFPWLQPGQPSPSQFILESVFAKLRRRQKANCRVKHLVSSPIVYATLAEALEVFMNFHMEGYFNYSVWLPEVLEELTADLLAFKRPDGSIGVESGCFVYNLERT